MIEAFLMIFRIEVYFIYPSFLNKKLIVLNSRGSEP